MPVAAERMRPGSDSAMAEEALRVVELEGLQAHGSPGRGGEGEDDPRVSGSPQHPQKGHGCGVLPSCGEQIRPGQLKEWLQETAVPPGTPPSSSSLPQGPPPGSHLTRRRHIFSWGNSLGPSTLGSWGSVSR